MGFGSKGDCGVSEMNYPGGKNNNGSYQQIISEIPLYIGPLYLGGSFSSCF